MTVCRGLDMIRIMSKSDAPKFRLIHVDWARGLAVPLMLGLAWLVENWKALRPRFKILTAKT